MPEQPVNLPITYLGVFSRPEQRVLQAIFKAIAEGGGTCAATMTMLARDSNTSKATTRTQSPERSKPAFSKRPSAALTATFRFKHHGYGKQ
jgi:hypothetical protein